MPCYTLPSLADDPTAIGLTKQKTSLENISNCLLRRDRDIGLYKMAMNGEEFRQVSLAHDLRFEGTASYRNVHGRNLVTAHEVPFTFNVAG